MIGELDDVYGVWMRGGWVIWVVLLKKEVVFGGEGKMVGEEFVEEVYGKMDLWKMIFFDV